ncbi:MAG: VCBS repeat-containing protein [Luteolibacter sp.]|uniref:FG-GAP repeat domain-containing protein n=1 Tax=Luteolibacter sp. TaxID=1962973 RepID=UPI0032648E9B
MKKSILLRSAITLAFVSPCLAAPPLTWTTRQLTSEFQAEGAAAGDFNKDGVRDVVYGPWWFEGPGFTEKHTIYPDTPLDPRNYSKNFFAYTPDLNADGWQDVLVLGFPGEESYWFENPHGAAGDWKRHDVLKVTDAESPVWTDLTGDGKPEIVCAQDGYFGYASPGTDPTQEWPFTRISAEKASSGRFTHGLGVGDVNGDGRLDLLEKNGWWEHPADPAAQPVWAFHPFPFSEAGGAQMFAYDFDGDGDNDIFTSLAAHAYGLAWYEQVKDELDSISFIKHELMPTDPKAPSQVPLFSAIHAVDLADINGDGVKDIVTGQRYWAHAPRADGTGGDDGVHNPPVLYWFEVKRGGKSGAAEFIPHLISNQSGVGTQVMVVDLDGKAPPEIVVGNKKGAFVSSATAAP